MQKAQEETLKKPQMLPRELGWCDESGGHAQPGLGAGSAHHVLYCFGALPHCFPGERRRLTLKTSETLPISTLPLGEVTLVLLHFSVSPPSAPTTLRSLPLTDEQVSTVVRGSDLRVRIPAQKNGHRKSAHLTGLYENTGD